MRKYQQIIGGVVGSVLWLGLSGHVWAHTQALPGCRGLPDNDFFGTASAPEATFAITPGSGVATITPMLNTDDDESKRGTGESGEGNTRYRYTKITVPQLAAGELRVFSTDGAPVDAVLCYGSSERARYKTTYTSDHTAEESAAKKAFDAADAAVKAATDAAALRDRTTNPNPSQAEDNARTALRTAATALDNASKALESADRGERATAPADRRGLAGTMQTNAETVKGQGTTSSTNAKDNNPDMEISDLGTINSNRNGGTGVAGWLAEAAATLVAEAISEDPHEGLELRATVNSGEGEYILVTVQSDPDTPTLNSLRPNIDGNPNLPAPDLVVQFHGVLSDALPGRQGDISSRGAVVSHSLTVTAPGLLTLKTTGQTDTKGTLVGATGPVANRMNIVAEDGGTSGNFVMAVPILQQDTAYTLRVAGQEDHITGRYTLDVAFAVAMFTAGITDVTVEPAPAWTGTVLDDDTELSIAPRSEDNNQADQDVFVFTPGKAGWLTVRGVDGATTPIAQTQGALYGARGQIATDTRTPHFRFAVPVQADMPHLVHVTSTKDKDGSYGISFRFDAVVDGTDTSVQPTRILTGQTIDPQGTNAEKDRNRYLFEVTSAGALYLQSTGGIDVKATLYGPDGTPIQLNDNGGSDNNFRIAANVTPGLYLLEVEGQTGTTEGSYDLTANFAEDVTVEEPTTRPPVTDTDTDTDTEIDPDPHGVLEEPGHDDIRSGVVMVRGGSVRMMAMACGSRFVTNAATVWRFPRSSCPMARHAPM